MDKVDELVDFVEVLMRRFGKTVAVEDHWAGDHTAVGVARHDVPGRLAYVRVISGGADVRYYVALELPARPGSDLPYESAGERDDLGRDEAIHVVAEHLGLP
jgi:hypothetical protein